MVEYKGTASGETVPEIKRRSVIVKFFIRLLKEKPLGVVGGFIVLVLLITGIFADFLAPYEMNKVNLIDRLSRPSVKYLLGTDHLGRDVLTNIIYGARISVIIGLSGAACSSLVGTVLGSFSGLIGGKLDMVVQRFVDAWMAIPNLLVLLIVMSLVGRGLTQIILVLGITLGITGSRVMRSAVIGIKENIYIEAARAVGGSIPHLLIRHILPNIMGPIIVDFTLRVGAVIMMEAGLSFLGFGVPPGVPSWGSMLSGEGRQFMEIAPMIAIWPGLSLSIVVYGVNMFGDALRDLLDPRLRGGVGRYGNVKKQLLAEKTAKEG